MGRWGLGRREEGPAAHANAAFRRTSTLSARPPRLSVCDLSSYSHPLAPRPSLLHFLFSSPSFLLQRQKDIDIGKSVPGYAHYTAAVPRSRRDPRKPEHPVVSQNPPIPFTRTMQRRRLGSLTHPPSTPLFPPFSLTTPRADPGQARAGHQQAPVGQPHHRVEGPHPPVGQRQPHRRPRCRGGRRRRPQGPPPRRPHPRPGGPDWRGRKPRRCVGERRGHLNGVRGERGEGGGRSLDC